MLPIPFGAVLPSDWGYTLKFCCDSFKFKVFFVCLLLVNTCVVSLQKVSLQASTWIRYDYGMINLQTCLFLVEIPLIVGTAKKRLERHAGDLSSSPSSPSSSRSSSFAFIVVPLSIYISSLCQERAVNSLHTSHALGSKPLP